MKIVRKFCVLLNMFFLLACAEQKNTSPTSISHITTPTPVVSLTPTPTKTPTSTNIPETETPLPGYIYSGVPDDMDVDSTQFCIDPSYWSCSCGETSHYIEMKEANRAGWCDIQSSPKYYSKPRFSIALPNNWYCNGPGALYNSLTCVTDDNFFRLLWFASDSLIDINSADSFTVVLSEGDGRFMYQAVAPNEKKMEQEVKSIGIRQVLRLLTQQEDIFVLRYFIEDEDILYVFITTLQSLDNVEYQEMTTFLEEVVRSMRFFD